jgi:rSAM/selenodomain-associated transferase 1
MESSARPLDPVRVAVFAKAPVAGTVKTRLAPVLGLAGAARLHALLVDHALAQAVAAAVGPVELWCAPDASHPFFAECAARHAVRLREQSEGDLGARMARAFATARREGSSLVLVGSDCPALDGAAIAAAAHALSGHAAAIAPAEDGGYGLIALAQECPALFEGIAWGTATVMAETRCRLEASRLKWLELPRTWDVDRPEDYARLRREPRWTAELA